MPSNSEIVSIGWVLIFVILIPALTYRSALVSGTSSSQLIKISFSSLVIPTILGIYTLLAYANIITIDLGFSPNDFTPHEFFTELYKVHAPYEIFVLTLIALQIAVTLILISRNGSARAYTKSIGFSGFQMAIVFGYLALNKLLGQWPPS